MRRGAELVGRVDELRMLAERLVAARGGTGGLVLVTGEPGIGKTRLAQELAGLADRQGVAVVWGRCREDGGAPAYFPWVQIVKRAADRAGLAVGELDRRWPEIASLVGTAPAMTAPAVEPAERFRLFASVASLLDHCAKSRGLVVIIDDLHRADEGSLALLRFLAPDLPDMPVLTVAAYRDSEVDVNHSLADTIGASARPTTTSSPWGHPPTGQPPSTSSCTGCSRRSPTSPPRCFRCTTATTSSSSTP